MSHDIWKGAFCALFLWGCSTDQDVTAPSQSLCNVELIVLGAGQDAGIPQIGNDEDSAWETPSKGQWATSLALVDNRSGERFLFEATPDIREQLHYLNSVAPTGSGSLGLSGVFLTHAHIGHYAGLMFFGHESAGTNDIPVYAMPRMGEYLRKNGPWSQLVAFENIELRPLLNDIPMKITADISVTPILVPHRDEYSETVGYRITGANKSALFIPDIDSWDRWADEFEHGIFEQVDAVDYAFLDATFYDNKELPGRDMTKIPHPRVRDTMEELSSLPKEQKKGTYFIHYNHTNPIRYPGSLESDEVAKHGFSIARQGTRICFD